MQPLLLGLAAGVMSVASIAGLILPGLDQGSAWPVAAGFGAGVAFLLVVARGLEAHERHLGRAMRKGVRTTVLVFVVLLAHSLPEGFAIGTAYASEAEGLSLFVIVAIAVQNIPEGTSVAIPMAEAGYSRSRQFWGAVATSAPQPVGALVAFLLVERIDPLLPVSFGFAAGAMLALVATELAPRAFGENARSAAAGLALGATGMVALSAALGV
jgi:ZIP family zinc transporter